MKSFFFFSIFFTIYFLLSEVGNDFSRFFFTVKWCDSQKTLHIYKRAGVFVRVINANVNMACDALKKLESFFSFRFPRQNLFNHIHSSVLENVFLQKENDFHLFHSIIICFIVNPGS